jgi:hypothetical protein
MTKLVTGVSLSFLALGGSRRRKGGGSSLYQESGHYICYFKLVVFSV